MGPVGQQMPPVVMGGGDELMATEKEQLVMSSKRDAEMNQ